MSRKDTIGYSKETPEWKAAYDAAIDELDRLFPAASARAAIVAESFRLDAYTLPTFMPAHRFTIINPPARELRPITSINGLERKPEPPSNHSVG